MPSTIGITTTAPTTVGRAPQMIMRKSTDGGHTFGNSQIRDCGEAGQFHTRVRWLQLGRARDLVIEISCSDAVPWRVVDSYIEIIPGTGI